jgi:hypothetical protein
MELRDGDLVLRPWTEDDVDAMVVGCNDPDVARWIPTIPSPYTREDALAFIRGEIRPDHQALAIELDERVVGGIGWASTRTSIARRWATGSRHPTADRASVLVRCDFSPGMRSTISRSNGSISSPIPTTSRRNVSPRRSGSNAKASFARISGIPTDAFATR